MSILEQLPGLGVMGLNRVIEDGSSGKTQEIKDFLFILSTGKDKRSLAFIGHRDDKIVL